jgi:ATP phosphoribosyltransferase
VVPENSPIQRIEDLAGKRIATEAVGITRRFLQAHGIEAAVEFSWGATEVKVPELVDAIVEITETGASLQANNLRILEVLTESYPQVIANHAVMQDAWKETKLRRIFLLKDLLLRLPALRNPTISPLAQNGWVAIETIIDETVVREIIPELKVLGAEGIIEYPLNKVVY